MDEFGADALRSRNFSAGRLARFQIGSPCPSARLVCCPLTAHRHTSVRDMHLVVNENKNMFPWLRAYYDGLLLRGKPRKVALVAAMRKLLAAVWSVATNRMPFVPQLRSASAT